MYRFRKFDDAKEKASECGLMFGFCVFDGMHYVGTKEQLQKIGCLYIQ